jgi:hypothetical protein
MSRAIPVRELAKFRYILKNICISKCIKKNLHMNNL